MKKRLGGLGGKLFVLTAVSAVLAVSACSSSGVSAGGSPAAGGSSTTSGVALKSYTDAAALEADAKKEGTLNIFISPDFQPFLVNGFKKAYPWAKVNYTGVQPDQAAAKLAAEVNSGLNQTDVAGMYPTAVGGFTAKNQLARVQVPNDAQILPTVKDPQGFFFPMTNTSDAFVYNTDLVKTPPKSLADLADPAWANKLVIQTPIGSGTGEQAFAMPYSTWGDAKWTTWLDGLAKNKPQFVDSNSTAFASVLRGDRAICICNYHDFTNAPKSAPLAASFWDQDTFGALGGGVGAVITAKAPHPAMAALWLNYMLDPKGGQAGMVASGRASSIVGVAGGDVLPAGTKIANFNTTLGDLIKRPDFYETAYKKAFGL
jgi:iron(III) transport system substrate-binding protein